MQCVDYLLCTEEHLRKKLTTHNTDTHGKCDVFNVMSFAVIIKVSCCCSAFLLKKNVFTYQVDS